MNDRLRMLLYGGVEFSEPEEYRGFQFRFFYILLLFGAGTSGLFVWGHHSGANILSEEYILAAEIHIGIALLIMIVLYGRKYLYYPLAVIYAAVCFFVFVSALFFVPNDELRVVWFILNLSGVYLLLGRLAGMVATLFSMVFLIIVNPQLSRPYSSNALGTLLVACLYSSVFFHVYSGRSLSFFQRMLRSNEELHYLATHDPLTGVLNARAYYAVCDSLVEISKRERSHLAVLFVDLDHFKRINDSHGHATGDQVLKEVAACLKRHLRSSDVLGRVGGEEFSIFLPNTDLYGGMRVAEELREHIAEILVNVDQSPLKLTASIGVATNESHLTTVAALQRCADQAMYQAKQNGRNRVCGLDAALAS